jgi:hypothetical protein
MFLWATFHGPIARWTLKPNMWSTKKMVDLIAFTLDTKKGSKKKGIFCLAKTVNCN